MKTYVSFSYVHEMRDDAYAQVAEYPQYTREKFNAYVKVRIDRKVVTKMGEAFQKGEVVLADPSTLRHHNGRNFMTVWSYAHKIDTSVPASVIEVL